jgi:hypothetical protein
MLIPYCAQVLYQLGAGNGGVPHALEKAMATLNATMPLVRAFHAEDVTPESLTQLELLAVRNIEVWSQYDPDRLSNKKMHATCHCVDSVNTAGCAHEYCTAQFERRHKYIRLASQLAH